MDGRTPTEGQMTGELFERLYRSGVPLPWDCATPTPFVARLADRGEICDPVLDVGCGTGQDALFLAGRGHRVVGVDVAPTAIARARRKAIARGISVDFHVCDARDLDGVGGPFETIIDAALFHFFTEEADRAAHVQALTRVCRPGGALLLLCFNERFFSPGTAVGGAAGAARPGPLRQQAITWVCLSESDLRRAFAVGWRLDALSEENYGPKRFWLALFRRL